MSFVELYQARPSGVAGLRRVPLHRLARSERPRRAFDARRRRCGTHSTCTEFAALANSALQVVLAFFICTRRTPRARSSVQVALKKGPTGACPTVECKGGARGHRLHFAADERTCEPATKCKGPLTSPCWQVSVASAQHKGKSWRQVHVSQARSPGSSLRPRCPQGGTFLAHMRCNGHGGVLHRSGRRLVRTTCTLPRWWQTRQPTCGRRHTSSD